jgi:hypothetical protein
MNVRACRVAGGAGDCYGIAALHSLARLHQVLRIVGVSGAEVMTMFHNHDVAIAAHPT